MTNQEDILCFRGKKSLQKFCQQKTPQDQNPAGCKSI